MEHAGGVGRGRRGGALVRGALVRAVAVALALGAVAAGAPPWPGPQRELRVQPVSVTDPAPPTDVVVTPADRALAVAWTAPKENFLSGYRVYVDGVLRASPTSPGVTLTGLVNGTPYVVTVTSVTTRLLVEHEGTQASAPVTGVPRDAVPPAAPAVTATRGDGRVSLVWPAAPEYDVDAYEVLRDGAAVSGLLGRATTSWTDTAVVNDRTYRYAVRARDTSGNWSPLTGPGVAATPTDLTAPSAPADLVAQRG
ncbi:fibronectin type III domain-containing protein, partial [Vallicoccus soli]